MKIDEITRNAFLAPLFCICDPPQRGIDDEGEEPDEDDLWNIYNPDMLHIPEEDRKELLQCRQNTRDAAEVYRQDVEAFLECVPDERTLKSAMDMVSSRGDLEAFYATCLEYSEKLTAIAALEESLTALKPLAKEHPELQKTIKLLKRQISNLRNPEKRIPHGFIQKTYNHCVSLFKKMYPRNRFPITLKTFGNYMHGCKGRYSKGFPTGKNWENKQAWLNWINSLVAQPLSRKRTLIPLDKLSQEDVEQ